MRRLLILGATGGTGRELVVQALAAGHEVTAFVRDPAKLPAVSVRTVVGDIGRDVSPIAEALRGQDAVISAVRNGLTIGARNIYEARLAELICSRFPAIDSVRFTNSGTEASFLATAAARALTGRRKILVFERGYHGGFFVFKRR